MEIINRYMVNNDYDEFDEKENDRMLPAFDGEWVKYSDYAALRARLEENGKLLESMTIDNVSLRSRLDAAEKWYYTGHGIFITFKRRAFAIGYCFMPLGLPRQKLFHIINNKIGFQISIKNVMFGTHKM